MFILYNPKKTYLIESEKKKAPASGGKPLELGMARD